MKVKTATRLKSTHLNPAVGYFQSVLLKQRTDDIFPSLLTQFLHLLLIGLVYIESFFLQTYHFCRNENSFWMVLFSLLSSVMLEREGSD